MMRHVRILVLAIVLVVSLLLGAVQGDTPVPAGPWPASTPWSRPDGARARAPAPGAAASAGDIRRTVGDRERIVPSSTVAVPGAVPSAVGLRAGGQAAGWVTILNETFEGTFPGVWHVFDDDPDGGDHHWGRRNCRAYGGSYGGWAVGGGDNGSSLSCGRNYPDDVASWMIYGPFSLSDATAADLTFKLWLNSETDYDTFFWGVSRDGYDFYRSAAEPPMSGSTGGWVDKGLDMSNVAGLGSVLGQPQVWIAFVFSTDLSVNYPEGAYLDNIVLRKNVPSGGATPTPTTPIPSWPLLYQDDFGSPATGWPVGTWQCMDTAYQSGEYRVGMMCPGYIPLRLLLDVTDFDFRLDARWVVQQQDVSYVLLFRIMNEARSFYWFEVAPNGQAYSVYRVLDGDWSVLIDWTPSPYINTGTNTNALRVVGIGSSFRVYVNGYQVGSFSDTSLPVGGTGFAVYNYNASGVYRCAFDNYKLWGQTGQQVTPSPTRTSTRTRTPTLPPGGLKKIHLPVALRRLAAVAVALPNGRFENGDLGGWQQGGELVRRVVSDVVHQGRYAVLLGDRDAGPCSAPTGQGWIEQEFDVPATGNPRLSLWYRLRTYDRNRDLVDTFDSFDVLLNGQRVLRDANRTLNPSCSGQAHDLGWKEFVHDLSPYRGQRVRLRLLLRSTDQHYNTWVYVDDVVLLQ